MTTDNDRADLIEQALSDDGETVTRWVVAYEVATPDGGFALRSLSTSDPPWILAGMVEWIRAGLLDTWDPE